MTEDGRESTDELELGTYPWARRSSLVEYLVKSSSEKWELVGYWGSCIAECFIRGLFSVYFALSTIHITRIDSQRARPVGVFHIDHVELVGFFSVHLVPQVLTLSRIKRGR